MASQIDPSVFQRTKDTLGKAISKPPMTEKLLSRPPFRYLHDVIMEVNKSTGFFNGLYSSDESDAKNVQDKEAKIMFLQKAIDTLAFTTGELMKVKPSKIVAGSEPERTNEFLQMLGTALLDKQDSSAAIKKVLAGEKPTEKLAKEKKKGEAESGSTAEKKRTEKKGASDGEKKATEKKGSKEASSEKKKGLEKKGGVSKEPSSEKKGLEKKGGVSKEASSEKKGLDKKGVSKEPSGEKKGLEKKGVSKEASGEKRGGEKKGKSVNKEASKKGVSKEASSERRGSEKKGSDRKGKEASSEKKGGVSKEEKKGKEEKELMSKEAEKKGSASSKEANAEKMGSRSGEKMEAVSGEKMEKGEQPKEDSRKRSGSKGHKPSRTRPPLETNEQGDPPVASEEEASNADAKIDRPPCAKGSRKKKRSVPQEELEVADEQIEDENVHLKRQPSSPPVENLMNRNLEATTATKSLRPTSGDVRGELDDDLPPTVIMDTGGGDNMGDDDDDQFIVEESKPLAQPLEETFVTTNEGISDDKPEGALTKNIVAMKEHLEGTTGKESQEQTLLPTINEAQRRKEREMVTKEIEKLQSSIQTLCKSANPLGKIMDYVQEDIDSMQKELEMWESENNKHAEALMMEQSITDKELQPLRAQLKELEAKINEQVDMISGTKANILKNDIKTQQMLNSLTFASS